MISRLLQRLLGSRPLGSKGSLRQKTVAGSQWLMARSAVLGFTDLLRAVIFARILFPDDYGLMALAMIPIGLFESFSTTGIDILIQRDSDEFRRKLESYWTIKLVRGFLLTVLTWFAAEPLASYYQRPDLIPLVRFLAVRFLVLGCCGFGKEVRQRSMDFVSVALVESASSVAVFLVSIGAVFVWGNVWALAIFSMATAVSILVSSYILYPWRPGLRLERSILKDVAAFSGSLVIMNLFNAFFSYFDNGVVGKLLGVEELGYYARAYFLALIPVTYFANVVAPIFLPVFRQVADDAPRLRRAFGKSALVMGLLVLIMGGVFFLFAREIVVIVYGRRWLPVLPVFQVLLIFGLGKSIVAICPSIFFLRNKPWMITLSTAVMVAVFGVLCIPLTMAYHLLGTAWSVVIASILSYVLSFALVGHLLARPAQTRVQSREVA